MKRLIVILSSLLFSQCAIGQSSFFNLGTNFTVTGQNFPSNFSGTALLSDGASSLLNSGQVSLRVNFFIISPGDEWIQFTFNTVNGGPLAGNLSSGWRFDIPSIPLTQSALTKLETIYFTRNGVAASPITQFSGFQNVIPNPINPALGPVYSQSSNQVETNYIGFANIQPYNQIQNGGMDPNLINGVVLARRLVAVPEPATLAALGAGGLAVGIWFTRRRSRKGKKRRAVHNHADVLSAKQ